MTLSLYTPIKTNVNKETPTMGLPNVSTDWPDDEWDDRRGVGLSNLGNTCYQNAIIQCLIHNKTFVSSLPNNDINSDSIAHHFLCLSRALADRQESVIRAEGIRDAMAKRHPWLGDGRQHDAQEFLVLLLDQLHDQLKRHDSKRVKVDDNDDDVASREWRRFLQMSGTSVVSDTFQGQLCSSVTCLHCKQTSLSFEPFMYLCVPVPVSLSTTLCVTFCPLEGQPSTHELTVDNKYESIRVIKDKLRQLAATEMRDDDLVIAEVDAFHVKRLLDDSDDVLSVGSELFVFELNACCVSQTEWRQNCPICLEAFDGSQLLSHSSLCSSAVCNTCLTQLEHYGHEAGDGKRFSCHACQEDVSKDNFSASAERCQFPIPLLFRSADRLLHRVHVLRVSPHMEASQVYSLVDGRVPWPELTYRLTFVERDANGCCRCSWGSSCDGCELSRDGSVSLLPSDTLCVTFVDPPIESERTETEPKRESQHSKLELKDCLRAFGASETSDWFCDSCRQLRAAHKTLRVTRAPHTLIVSLKRFLFFGNKSHKIKDEILFPIDETLDLTLLLDQKTNYRLRAVVLHSGSTVSSGHYSAFVWDESKWLLCNDAAVSAEEPVEGDCRAYILFYDRIVDN